MPGPTFEVRENQAILVRYVNRLPEQHLLTVDRSVHGAEPFRPEVRNVVHLHGGNVEPEYDGNPDTWFTPGTTHVGPTFVTTLYEYPNRQPATTLWYHDHAVGITRLNVYAGLAGCYLIRTLRRSPGRLFLLPGSDLGFLEIPLLLNQITLGPGERADVIVDFTGRQGTTFTLTNSAPPPFPGGDPPGDHTRVIMQFRVVLPMTGKENARIPATLPASDRPRLGVRDVGGEPLPLMWGDSTTEFPRFGTVEIWELINTTADTHPIHLHLVRFGVLSRQRFDVDRLQSTGDLVFTGPPIPGLGLDAAMKDTVKANPGEVTRIIARFGDFSGLFVWHCHILEHEDHEMMRRYWVTCDRWSPVGPVRSEC